MKKKLTIIIPAKKEENSIIETLESLKRKVKTPHKIIVVNDSTKNDKTGELVRNYARKNKNVTVIIKRGNKKSSFASALMLGFNKVKSGFIVPVMADLCDRPEDIDVMYEKIQEGWDIVCASRYMRGGGKKGGPVVQSVCSYIVCITLHFLTGIATKDVSNAFKMYRKTVLDKVKINPENGVELSMAIVLQAHFKNYKITEIPTRWVGRTLGKSKFKIVDRTPPYSKIYLWTICNILCRRFHLKYIPYSLN